MPILYLKHYNHNHDKLGRFASTPGGAKNILNRSDSASIGTIFEDESTIDGLTRNSKKLVLRSSIKNSDSRIEYDRTDIPTSEEVKRAEEIEKRYYSDSESPFIKITKDYENRLKTDNVYTELNKITYKPKKNEYEVEWYGEAKDRDNKTYIDYNWYTNIYDFNNDKLLRTIKRNKY